jgi:hypothetical protein
MNARADASMLMLLSRFVRSIRPTYLNPLFQTASSPGFRGGRGIKEGKFIKEGFFYKDL